MKTPYVCFLEVRHPQYSTRPSALFVMRSMTTTCLFETSRRAEATAFLARLNLKEKNVVLNFYERFYAIRTLIGI